ncbi:MAG TPA: alpha/beta hydrolase family protein [Phototrophicaceae bacterium]|nr:alpha/beta hydrolase family protein [Phototrophicaceae bacterium]
MNQPVTHPMNNRFHLQAYVDQLYAASPREWAFVAPNQDIAEAWQIEFRTHLSQVLGIAHRPQPAIPHVELLSSVDRGMYLEEKYALNTGELEAPMYLLIPKTPPPYKAVLAFHGHAPGVGYILGHYADPVTEQAAKALDENFAQRLVEDGYLVCAVEQQGFGERITGLVTNPENRSCRHLAFDYLLQGHTLIGERVREAMIAIDYLQTRPDVMPGVLGCTGHSGGGMTTLYLSALDERITVSVPVAYFCSFEASILRVQHCECNYVPGILEAAEMGDLAALITPRPLRIVSGENDPIFGIDGVREQYQIVERAYHLFDAVDQSSLAVHPGVHQYHYGLTRDWLSRWL